MKELNELLQFCTDNQRMKLEAVIEHGSRQKAADALGCCKTAVTNAVTAARLKATQRGFAPNHDMTKTVPEGFTVKGVSTLYDVDGNVKVQWVKSQADKERQEQLLRIFVDTLADDVAGLSAIIPMPKDNDKDLLAFYPLPEPHFGMFSWGKETGDDYDCTLAGNILCSGMENLVDSAPKASTAIISNLGDWFHTDTTNNVTAKAGNQLDVDSRWPRVVKLGIGVLIKMVNLALAKHEQVKIIGVGGNHDPQTSYMVALVLDAYFNNNPRVSVDLGPSPFKYFTFGQNLIGINHGDMAKPDQLPLIMASDCPEWSSTKFRVWWTAHIHHLTRKEYTGGVVVETIRSASAKDSWHHASGYRSGREAIMVVYHKERGEIQRHTVAI